MLYKFPMSNGVFKLVLNISRLLKFARKTYVTTLQPKHKFPH